MTRFPNLEEYTRLPEHLKFLAFDYPCRVPERRAIDQMDKQYNIKLRLNLQLKPERYHVKHYCRHNRGVELNLLHKRKKQFPKDYSLIILSWIQQNLKIKLKYFFEFSDFNKSVFSLHLVKMGRRFCLSNLYNSKLCNCLACVLKIFRFVHFEQLIQGLLCQILNYTFKFISLKFSITTQIEYFTLRESKLKFISRPIFR